jgi:hypothetical protein
LERTSLASIGEGYADMMCAGLERRVLRAIKPSFLFFFSGVVAGGGVNLMTGAIGSSSSRLVIFSQLWWGVFSLVMSFMISLVAGSKEETDWEYGALMSSSLTKEEKDELMERLIMELAVRVRPFLLWIVVNVTIFVGGYLLLKQVMK